MFEMLPHDIVLHIFESIEVDLALMDEEAACGSFFAALLGKELIGRFKNDQIDRKYHLLYRSLSVSVDSNIVSAAFLRSVVGRFVL
jgi:hypothetical protein